MGVSLPRTPSLATSFGLPNGNSPPEMVKLALRERVSLRTVSPPPFSVTPGEGTLSVDFVRFDKDLTSLLASRDPGASSVEIDIPAEVPAPRRLEYLMAVKRHLAERELSNLMVNFSEEGALLGQVSGQGGGLELLSAPLAQSAHGSFWWQIPSGAAAPAAAQGSDPEADSPQWLDPSNPGYRIRSIAWAAFRAGATGLYGKDTRDLFYIAPDGTPRESLRLKMLRKGLEDFEYLRMAQAVDPVRTREILD